jgi:hypothetical protein
LSFSLTQSTNNHSQASNVSQHLRQQHAAEEEGDEEEDEEEENRTPSPRYQKYLSYFKGDTKSSSDPFVMPRSRYSSPVGSPYSNAATMGSPSFRGGLSTFDDSGDESEAELPSTGQQSRVRFALNKVNPVNWMPNPKSWFARSPEYSNPGIERETDNQNMSPANFNFGSRSVNVKGFPTPNVARPSTSSNALSGFNGNSSPRASLANQIYSPAQPPPPPIVPPQMAAARQAGFKSFFSRGERNGYGNVGPTDTPSDTAHLVPKILLLSFIVGILGVFGLYYYKISDGGPTKMLNEWGSYITSLAQSIFFFGLCK